MQPNKYRNHSNQSQLRSQLPKGNAPKKIILLAALSAIVAITAGIALLLHNRERDEQPAEQNSDVTQNQETFDKTQHSLDDPASQWVVVNKQRPLDPPDYEPAFLRTPHMNVKSTLHQVNNQAATALEELNAAALNDGIELLLVSAYRSYSDQNRIYQSMVAGYGQTQADRESARPGHSEHQTGWAADLGAPSGECELKTCFAKTPEGRWLAANAHKFGFIIRYPEGAEHITGYAFEPWHLRFVGKKLSAEMHQTGVKTLEEFFGLPFAPNY